MATMTDSLLNQIDHDTTPENARELLAELQRSASSIEWEYDGSGDEGHITETRIYRNTTEVTLPEPVTAFAHALVEHIMFHLYKADFSNNEGGYGDGTLDLATLTWKVDGAIRVVTSEDASESGVLSDAD